MIINNFLQWVIEILGGSYIEVNFYGSISSYFMSIINLIAYILPLDVIIQIATITIVLYLFRVTVAFFHSLWSFIPVA